MPYNSFNKKKRRELKKKKKKKKNKNLINKGNKHLADFLNAPFAS